MSRQQREIEAKYQAADVASIEDALAGWGLPLSRAVFQDDQAYARSGWRYGMSKLGVPFARLRTEESQHIFTVKTPQENEMACLEYETYVEDRTAMHCAVVAMGFYPTVRIVKNRRTARCGAIAICVDEVERLGTFLEVERIVGAGQTGPEVQAELDAFVQSLGVYVQRTTNTYDSMLLRNAQPVAV